MFAKSEYQPLDDADNQFSIKIETKLSWNHIQNLDKFLSNVYYFHQQDGFYVNFIEFLLQILKFFFIIWVLSVLVNLCFFNFQVVKNDTIIYERFYNPIILRSENTFTTVFVIVSFLLLTLFVLVTIPKLKHFYSISKFYSYALNIPDDAIPDKTWSDVLESLAEVQNDLQICVHKKKLTNLDICNRILRRQNYLIAMITHEVFPVESKIPVYGDFVIVTKYFIDSIKFLLFKFPFRCPFGDHWQLRPEYKQISNQKDLANQIRQLFIIMGLFQLLISPICFLYLSITKACTYGHGLRINPGHFVNREVTPLGRLKLCHYNELPHEFTYRISKAYPAVNQYLDSFLSKIIISLARIFRFLSGGIIFIGFLISMVENRFLLMPHVVSIGLAATVIYTLSSKLIPDESMVVSPKLLINEILSHVHCVPDEWKDNPHTRKTCNEVSKLFQPKMVNIVKELLSCFWCPIMFLFWMPNYTYKIVDFLRNYTIELNGVGDICSFAQMEVNKYGSPSWFLAGDFNNEMTEVNNSGAGTSSSGDNKMSNNNIDQRQNGKVELSLINFQANNPKSVWSKENETFLNYVNRVSCNAPIVNPGADLRKSLIINNNNDGSPTKAAPMHLKNANKVAGVPSFDCHLNIYNEGGNAFDNYFNSPNLGSMYLSNESTVFDCYRSQYDSTIRDLSRFNSLTMNIHALHSVHDKKRLNTLPERQLDRSINETNEHSSFTNEDIYISSVPHDSL